MVVVLGDTCKLGKKMSNEILEVTFIKLTVDNKVCLHLKPHINLKICHNFF